MRQYTEGPMTVGEYVSWNVMKRRRHGVLLENADGTVCPMGTLTKRRSRGLWDSLILAFANPYLQEQRRKHRSGLVSHRLSEARTIYRVERGRVVAKHPLPAGDEPAGEAGVREPRDPHPSAGGAHKEMQPGAS